jgi:hypothetical protein
LFQSFLSSHFFTNIVEGLKLLYFNTRNTQIGLVLSEL